MIAGYIVDFFCPAARLAVEVDGESHREREPADVRRDADLSLVGVEVLRVDAEDVFDALGDVLARIATKCQERTK